MTYRVLSNDRNLNHNATSGPDSFPAESGGAVFELNDALGKNGRDAQQSQPEETRLPKSEYI
jgi:hypothetical protein